MNRASTSHHRDLWMVDPIASRMPNMDPEIILELMALNWKATIGMISPI